MIGPLGRLGAAATLGQHCPQMTQRRCTQIKNLISGVEQERDFFTLLLVEGSTGAERKEFLGGEGQKEFAPEEMEHIQVWGLHFSNL